MKKLYFVGIKGVAMTGLAVYFKEKGYQVEGSDVSDYFPTDKILKMNKILVKKGFKPENLDSQYEFVVVTGAHGGMTNPEAVFAQKKGFPVFTHGEILGKIMREKEGISVAGCHGKTTTSALVASILTQAGFNPSYLVGTPEITDLGPGGHFGKGKYFVAEADEYMTCPFTCSRPRFLWQKPKILVITNIDYDHPDAYKDIEAVKEAFLKFILQLPEDGVLIACQDNRNLAELLKKIKQRVITYGFSPLADYQIKKCFFHEGESRMEIVFQQVNLGEYRIYLAGKHNLLNSLAAMIVGNIVGISWPRLRVYLEKFRGTKRRLEKIGNFRGVLVYDDYAHHPTEIQSTLMALRTWFPQRRIFVLFQPHTFSRTKALFNGFARCFLAADFVLISEIYPSARETFDPTISSLMLVEAVSQYQKNVFYLSHRNQLPLFLKKKIQTGDILVTMGAGDIFLWQNDIRRMLR